MSQLHPRSTRPATATPIRPAPHGLTAMLFALNVDYAMDEDRDWLSRDELRQEFGISADRD